MPKDYWKYREYYRVAGRKYYQAHREQILQRVREYTKNRWRTDLKFREKREKSVREYLRKLYELWNGGIRVTAELIDKSEILVAEKILPSEGFSNIMPTSFNLTRTRSFPLVDVFCEKDGVKCGVAVTLHPYYSPRRKDALIKFIKFFNLRFFICWVKPNLKGYILLEVTDIDKLPTGIYLSKKKLALFKEISS